MQEITNILLIEDNPGDVVLVRNALREAPDFPSALIVAPTIQQGLKYIASEKLHVILLDLNLPDSTGIDTFYTVRKFSMHVPIIIMSILSDSQLIYQAMQANAQAYLIKGKMDSEALVRNIRFAIWSQQIA